MYLQKIAIKNFRCFDETGIVFTFQPGVNIIIGENNSGKSSLIDALRIVFSLGIGKREIFVTTSDFHLDENGIYASEISFDLNFIDLNEDEQAGFYELLVVEGAVFTAQLHIRVKKESTKGFEKINTQIWGGEKQGQPVSYGTLEFINHYYLGALRDAESDLRPGKGSRIGKLVRKLIENDDEKEAILAHIKTANRKILNEPKVKQASTVINDHLLDIEGNRLKQNINLGLVLPDFGRVTDSLRALLPPNNNKTKAVLNQKTWQSMIAQNNSLEQILNGKITVVGNSVYISISELSEQEKENIGLEIYSEILEHTIYFELDQNGMGYNNLIYMGTVLGDLQELKKVETCSYNTLLIEEPESHLHPQLQNLVFDFFKRVCSNQNGGAAPNSVQVFVTSHSPTLVSRADIDNIQLINHNEEDKVIVTGLINCPLLPDQKDDLRRYLDTTKSQLFFSRGVIFVEGISEALLLPIFANRMNRRLDQNAIEVVNISGTAFEPFALLFNDPDENKRINIRSVIMTDDDRCTSKDDVNRITDEMSPEEILTKLPNGHISPRAERAQSLQNENLLVKMAYKTFEFELAQIDLNLPVLLSALDPIHPRKTAELRGLFAAIDDPSLKAIYFWQACKDTKAEFAQRLATILNKRNQQGNFVTQFTIPQYIIEVIEHVAVIETD
ncbi:predicted ATP-dependent endonuclease of the OLD family [Longilinea arvoryzae]|uniref:Predicted ATP-dependent endonuclease of the OLD family n=1 Tax=Longilinea arvoryzae TaxID=360412 RepID=A0A0S7BHK2_9CHLR|nr:AAA family ATPase [Longilinea arvoryzae]GAP12986.1 predicted ATP-dependent endonuclease of the OLD family [Longilinea arvoryzae]